MHKFMYYCIGIGITFICITGYLVNVAPARTPLGSGILSLLTVVGITFIVYGYEKKS